MALSGASMPVGDTVHPWAVVDTDLGRESELGPPGDFVGLGLQYAGGGLDGLAAGHPASQCHDLFVTLAAGS